jgi:hypothetical protein
LLHFARNDDVDFHPLRARAIGPASLILIGEASPLDRHQPPKR